VRDDRVLRDGFVRWAHERNPDVGDIDVVVSRPQSGLSSETLFLRVTSQDAAAAQSEQSLVVRVPPEQGWLFPDYSLARQALVQNTLATTDVPVAAPVELVEDEQWIGAPFLVMPRVPGRVLTTNPSYVAAGWLHDASDDDRARLYSDFLEVMARVHRLDWRELGLGPLSGGGPELGSAVEWWREYLGWSVDDDDAPPEYARGLDWLGANLPDDPVPSLLWGDPQLVNAVFNDLRPAALLDWEMATFGPAEIDLAWFLSLHELTSAHVTESERATFPDRRETIATYENLLGRELDDLAWYEMFALVRSGAIVVRVARLMAAAGTEVTWLKYVPQTTRIRELLDDH
jgi:aminoglycoside phosphotransferase (APT) family kinase protein